MTFADIIYAIAFSKVIFKLVAALKSESLVEKYWSPGQGRFCDFLPAIFTTTKSAKT